MKQLKMLRPNQPLLPRKLPQGYTYDTFHGTDAEIEDWLCICRYGLIDEGAAAETFTSTIVAYPDLNPKRDLIFVLDEKGERVATIAAVLHGSDQGYIHMVAAKPSCRGKGIGHAMLYHALEMLISRGATYVTLTTDDFRLPAMKTYLDAGFLPVIYHDPDSDMKARWDAVIETLQYPSVSYITEI